MGIEVVGGEKSRHGSGVKADAGLGGRRWLGELMVYAILRIPAPASCVLVEDWVGAPFAPSYRDRGVGRGLVEEGFDGSVSS